MRMIHLRLNPQAPLTVCGCDTKDKDVLWATPAGFQELTDGELHEVEACPACKAAVATTGGR